MLDVKVGDGAFMKSLPDARALAETMLALGERAERDVVCVLTDMDQPLGCAVGNALEVREAVATLRGEGPADFDELVLDACAHLLALSDLGVDRAEGRRLAEEAVADGSALAAYERWVRVQGGDPDVGALPQAPVIREVAAPRGGYVQRLAALPVGIAALHLGAGRRSKDDPVDHAVGVVCRKKRGDAVEAGESLAQVHARDERSAAEAVAAVLAAYELSDEVRPCGRSSSRPSVERPRPGRLGRPGRSRRPSPRHYIGPMPELPEVETVRARLEPLLDRADARTRRDPRLAARAGRTSRRTSRRSSWASASLRSNGVGSTSSCASRAGARCSCTSA